MVKEYRMYYFFSTEIKGFVCVGAVLLFLFHATGAVNLKTETSLKVISENTQNILTTIIRNSRNLINMTQDHLLIKI